MKIKQSLFTVGLMISGLVSVSDASAVGLSQTQGSVATNTVPPNEEPEGATCSTLEDRIRDLRHEYVRVMDKLRDEWRAHYCPVVAAEVTAAGLALDDAYRALTRCQRHTVPVNCDSEMIAYLNAKIRYMFAIKSVQYCDADLDDEWRVLPESIEALRRRLSEIEAELNRLYSLMRACKQSLSDLIYEN